MSRYVASKYDNGEDIKMILNEMKTHPLDKPESLDSMSDDVYKYIYK